MQVIWSSRTDVDYARWFSLSMCHLQTTIAWKHSRPMSVFLQDFQCYMDTHITLPSKLVVLGDCNVHVDRKDNADARKFVDLLSSLNLEQHVHCPTHKHGHTLDLVILRATDAPPVQLEVHPAVLSDHSPITFKLHTRTPVPTKKHVSYRRK